MKASEARKLTEKNAKTFEQVVEEIKKRATQGKNNCEIFGSIQPKVVKKLEKNGFDVKDEYGRGYSIRW